MRTLFLTQTPAIRFSRALTLDWHALWKFSDFYMAASCLPITEPTVAQRFFLPLEQLLPLCHHLRPCPALPDRDWLRLLVHRVLHAVPSGRALLQEHAPACAVSAEVTTFFESLKSPRRLALVGELNHRLQSLVRQRQPDRLAAYPELDNFDVFAGDGHWHGAAVHDPLTQGTKHATGHFFGLNLRHGGVFHLAAADQVERLHEHDMRALKRVTLQTLSQGAPSGRQVLWVWDKAGIDFRQWHRWKHSAGIYFISRPKENMTRDVIGQQRWERDAPINQGIVDDVLVATSQGVAVRRVTYRNPVDGELFEFLTNEFELPPGLIAHLYRLRWDVEKVFDEFKNKLGQKKSWASSPTAKSIHAQLICLTHTLLLLFETAVVEVAGIRNLAEDARRENRLARVEASLAQTGERLPEAIRTFLRCTQHSVKLIRWLRSSLRQSTSCADALGRLRELYAKL